MKKSRSQTFNIKPNQPISQLGLMWQRLTEHAVAFPSTAVYELSRFDVKPDRYKNFCQLYSEMFEGHSNTRRLVIVLAESGSRRVTAIASFKTHADYEEFKLQQEIDPDAFETFSSTLHSSSSDLVSQDMGLFINKMRETVPRISYEFHHTTIPTAKIVGEAAGPPSSTSTTTTTGGGDGDDSTAAPASGIAGEQEDGDGDSQQESEASKSPDDKKSTTPQVGTTLSSASNVSNTFPSASSHSSALPSSSDSHHYFFVHNPWRSMPREGVNYNVPGGTAFTANAPLKFHFFGQNTPSFSRMELCGIWTLMTGSESGDFYELWRCRSLEDARPALLSALGRKPEGLLVRQHDNELVTQMSKKALMCRAVPDMVTTAPPSITPGTVATWNGTQLQIIPNPHRARLIAFYEKYNPEKLATVDDTIGAYLGDEANLFDMLVKKYGPEPHTLLQQQQHQAEAQSQHLHQDPHQQQQQSRSRAATTSGAATTAPTATPSSRASSASQPIYRPPTFKARLVAYYRQYAPGELDNVDSVLQNHAGREGELFSDLFKKFGPEPPAFEIQREGYRDRLVYFYQKHNPDKLHKVESTLAKWAGDEEELFSTLVAKYGPEPTTEEIANGIVPVQRSTVTATAPSSSDPPPNTAAAVGVVAAAPATASTTTADGGTRVAATTTPPPPAESGSGEGPLLQSRQPTNVENWSFIEPIDQSNPAP